MSSKTANTITNPSYKVPGEWYLELLGRPVGPFSSTELLDLVRKQEVKNDQRIRHITSEEWVPLSSVIKRQKRKTPESSDSPAAASPTESARRPKAAPPQPKRVPVPKKAVSVTPFFCEIFGEVLGPCTADDLVALAATGRLSPADKVRRGEGPWVAADKVRGLKFMAAAATADSEAVPQPKQSQSSERLIDSILAQAPDGTGMDHSLVHSRHRGVSSNPTPQIAALPPGAVEQTMPVAGDQPMLMANGYGLPPGYAYPPGMMMPGMMNPMMPGMMMQGPLGYGAYPLQPPVRRKKKKKKVKRQRRPESELPPGLLPPVVERPSAMASSRAVNLPPPELTGAKVEVVAPKKTDTNPEVNVRQLAQTALTKNMQLGNHVNFAASPRGRQDREKLHKTLAICGAGALVLVLGIIAFRGYSAGPFDRPGGAAYLEAQNLYSRIDSMMEGNANQSEWNELYSEHESVMGKLSPALESLAAKRTDLAAELSACHGESLKAVVNAKTPGERAEAQASLQTHLGNARKLFEKG